MRTTGPSSRSLTAVLLAAALCASATAACGDDGDSERSLLELRPVVASNPPPCPEKAPKKEEVVLPLTVDGKVTECLVLARPIIDAGDARSATVGETPAKEPALSVVLGATGSANLDGYAARNLGQRLAIVVDGGLVSAPVLRNTSFAGRVQVTGLSKEKTDNLFRRLNKLVKK